MSRGPGLPWHHLFRHFLRWGALGVVWWASSWSMYKQTDLLYSLLLTKSVIFTWPERKDTKEMVNSIWYPEHGHSKRCGRCLCLLSLKSLQLLENWAGIDYISSFREQQALLSVRAAARSTSTAPRSIPLHLPNTPKTLGSTESYQWSWQQGWNSI